MRIDLNEAETNQPDAPATEAAKPKAKRKAKATKPKKSVKKTAKAEVKLRPDGLRVGSAGGKLVDAICRKSGATHAELKAIVKWKSCLPFAMKSIEQAKVKLRKEIQDDRQVRYYGTARRERS